MTTPLTDAMAALVQSALPWLRYLDYPKPPYTPDEAHQVDLEEAALLKTWMTLQP